MSPAGLTIAAAAAPLLGFVVVFLFGSRLPRKGDWFAIGCVGVTLGSALVLAREAYAGGGRMLAVSWPWMTVAGGADFRVGIWIDPLSAILLVVVGVVSFLVHLYSTGYMHGDPYYQRFYAALQLFTAAMVTLVIADNLLLLYMGWELMGFCSYLLIGHDIHRRDANRAAVKAFMTTRLGDVLMFIGMLVVYRSVGSFAFADIYRAADEGTLSGDTQLLAALLLFGGAVGKSAQFPLHIWLPDAMEGPTPVSALIHAATMVAAGVYLVARLHPAMPPAALAVVAYLGGFTALFAATMGLVMNDLKKVLAYSTISQLGYMMLALGVGGAVAGGYTSGGYHLVTHAFFKACLFLGSGCVIHAVHSQMMPDMGGLWKKLPVTTATFVIATLALAGLWPLSGHFSKDGIVAAAIEWAHADPRHRLLPVFAVGSACLTSLYMFRLVFLTFTGAPRDQRRYEHAHENPWMMLVPIVVLAALCFPPVGGGTGNWYWSANPRPDAAGVVESASHAGAQWHAAGHEAHQAHSEAAAEAHHAAVVSTLIALLAGLAIAAALYRFRLVDAGVIARAMGPVHRLLVNKYYMDDLAMNGVVRPTLAVCRACAAFDNHVIDGLVNLVGRLGLLGSAVARLFDDGVVDGAVNGVAAVATGTGSVFSRMQNGRISAYLGGIVCGVVFLAAFVIWATTG